MTSFCASGSSMPPISLPDVELTLDCASKDALHILRQIKPEWCDESSADEVLVKNFDDGITNKVFGFHLKSDPSPISHKDMVLFRVFGEKTEKVITRQNEILTLNMLHQVGLGPELYSVFKNGLAYEYLKGVPLDAKSCRDPNIMRLTADTFAQWHCRVHPSESDFDFSIPMPILKTRQWLEQLSDHEGILLASISDKRFTIDSLKKELAEIEVWSRIDEPLVFSHNDTLLANLVYNEKENSVKLIDYEYGGPSYRAFDVGNHFDEMCGIGDVIDFSIFPSPEEQKQFITFYLDSFNALKSLPPPTADEVEEFYRNVGKMCLLSHFYWGVWSLLQSTISKIDFDYVQYSRDKLTEYYTRKEAFLNL